MLKNIVFVVICFFGSLSSYYFSSFGGIRLFEFIAFALMLLYIEPKKSDKSFRVILLYFTGIIIFGTISLLVSIINNSVNLYYNQFYGVLFTSLMAICFYLVFNADKERLLLGVKYLIILHTIFFGIQFISFYFYGNYIDFIKPLTGNIQRNIGGLFSGETAIRASGLYGEPAAYCLNILIFNFLYVSYYNRIKLMNVISLSTILLSMSSSGIIYLFLFLIILFLSNKIKVNSKAKILILFSLMVVIVIQLDIVEIDYLSNKISNFKQSESFQYRIGNVFKELQSFSDFEFLFGQGLGNLDVKYSKGSTYSHMLIEQGVLLSLVFFSSIFFLLKAYKIKNTDLLVVFMLFLGTHTFTQFQFWFFILTLAIFSKKREVLLNKNS